MFFRDIVGQEPLKSRFIQTVKENRVSHAWLLFGPEGSGSLPMALSFAGYVLCTNRNGDDACGTCASCRKTGRFIHPDMHFVFPVNKTKEIDPDVVSSDDFLSLWRSFINQNPYGRLTQWYNHINLDNKQGNINIEESKRLASKLSLKPFESDYKIVIIWMAEKMNDQSANRLLKLLEEPPPLTIFIMVSESPDQVIATIRSRCIPVKIPRITDTDMMTALMHRHQLAELDAVEITRLAEGNYLKALEIIAEGDSNNYNFIMFRDLMRSCATSNITQLIRMSEELSGLNREKQKSFLEYGLNIIRESMALHFETPELVHIPRYEMEFTPKFAPFINSINLQPVTNELSKAIRDIERNGNGKIIFMDLALKLSGLIKRQA